MQSASDTPSSHASSGHGRVRPSPQGTRRDGAVTRSGAAGATGLSPSARRKGDGDVPFRILSTATLRRQFYHWLIGLVSDDLPLALAALSEVTQQCVACHATFRIH